MTTPPGSAPRPAVVSRWTFRGFVVGVLVTVPAVFLALLTPVGETLLPVLVPGAALLAPMSDTMSTWNAAVSITLTAVVNGCVYALVGAGLAALTSRARRG